MVESPSSGGKSFKGVRLQASDKDITLPALLIFKGN